MDSKSNWTNYWNSNYNIHLLSSLKEFRFLRLDTEDENASTEMGKAEADGPAQRTNPRKRTVMGGLGLMFEGERNRKNTMILSNGGWTGIVTVHCILYCLHMGIYNDRWPNLSWVSFARMGNKGGRHNKIPHQLTSGTSPCWLPIQSAKIGLLQMVIERRSLMWVLFITSTGDFLSPPAAAGSYSDKAASISFLSSPAEHTSVFMDGHASPFLPCSSPVEKIKFLKTVSSLKLWFNFMIHGFALAIEFDIQIRTWVCPCKGWEKSVGLCKRCWRFD